MKTAIMDFRNEPVPPAPNTINLRSARAVLEGAQADVARVQPFIFKWNGKWVTEWEWDERMLHITRNGRHILPSPINGSDIAEAYVLDISVPFVRDELIDLISDRFMREHVNVIFDYATWDLSWEPTLGNVTPDKWMKWGYGWSLVKENFDDAWLQNHKPLTHHKLFLEKVGWTLQPIEAAINILAARRDCMVRWRDISAADRPIIEWALETYGGIKTLWWDDVEPI
jgi:hypothetical protein